MLALAPEGSIRSTLDVNPQLCAPGAGIHNLDGASPCVGAIHDGGNIGAFEVGCEVPVLSMTWDWLEARF